MDKSIVFELIEMFVLRKVFLQEKFFEKDFLSSNILKRLLNNRGVEIQSQTISSHRNSHHKHLVMQNFTLRALRACDGGYREGAKVPEELKAGGWEAAFGREAVEFMAATNPTPHVQKYLIPSRRGEAGPGSQPVNKTMSVIEHLTLLKDEGVTTKSSTIDHKMALILEVTDEARLRCYMTVIVVLFDVTKGRNWLQRCWLTR